MKHIRESIAEEIVLKLTRKNAQTLYTHLGKMIAENEEYLKFLLSLRKQLAGKLKGAYEVERHKRAMEYKLEKRATRMMTTINTPRIIKPGDPRWREIPQNTD